MGTERSWLGVYTTNHEVWETVKGGIIDDSLIKWYPGQPNNKLGNEFFVVAARFGGPDGTGLHDADGSAFFGSICDMTPEL